MTIVRKIMVRSAGGLRRRFALLLVLLAIVSVVPWWLGRTARHEAKGTARVVDLAGSVRYRLFRHRTALDSPDQPERLDALSKLIVAQRHALTTLINGDPATRIPACRRAEICARLRHHLAVWETELAPGLSNAGLSGRISAELSAHLLAEFSAIDTTVHMLAADGDAAHERAMNRQRLAALLSLALVVLGGLGVWDVFSRIRGLRAAAATPDVDAGLAELGAGSDEVAELARTIAASMRELKMRSFAASLASLVGLEESATRLADQLQSALEFDLAYLWLFDEDGGTTQTWKLADGSATPIAVACDVDVPDAATVLDAGQVSASAVLESTDAPTLALALRDQDHLVGLIVFTREGGFEDEDLAAADDLGPDLARVIVRLQSEEGRRLSQQLAALGGFSHMLAHELRNPLNAASLQLQLLERRARRAEGPLGEKDFEKLTAARAELDRIEALSTHYQTLQGDMGRFEEVEMGPLIEDAMAPYRESLKELGITCTMSLGDEPFMATVDRERVRLMVGHLIENAIDALADWHARDIEVRLSPGPDQWEVSVRDSGPGLKDPGRIFSPDYSTKRKGAGMGLPLSLHIARLHSGKLIARQHANGGAEFVVILPTSPPLISEA